jgi:hypothetical protein
MANKWELETNLNGTIDVRLNRHGFAYDCDDEREALARIRRSRKFADGDVITLADQSGYRTRLKRMR